MSSRSGKPSAIDVYTQFPTNWGIVDLVLRSDDAIVFIEVKVDSVLHEEQMERYYNALHEQSEIDKALGSLTRTEPNAANPTNFNIGWNEIGDDLREMRPTTDVGQFIANEFLHLLQHRGLVMARVSWELINGVRSFVSLIEMMNQSIALLLENATIQQTRVVNAQDYFGNYVWINETKFFIGVYFSEPGTIYFNNEDSIQLPENVEVGIVDDDSWVYRVLLDSEDSYFFSRSLQSQRAYIRQKISEAIEFANNLTG